jgi:circadian clock protein KaiC
VPSKKSARIATGVPGLDDILFGGLPAHRVYLVQGDPGAGKTTLAMQFLLEGVRRQERVLYVTLSETRDELIAGAGSHDWSLEGVDIYEMSGSPAGEINEDENTLYVPGDIELGERMDKLLAEIDRVKPTRIVLDSCTELRLLAQTALRFRRQVLALKADLSRRDCTVLLIENPVNAGGDPLLQSLVHGVVVMEQIQIVYGAERRRLRVNKLRESPFRGGYHDMRIKGEGVVVFPRLVASEHHTSFARDLTSSGLPRLDAMLGGGLDRGSSTLILGPAGSGKSALTNQYVAAAALRGERSSIFTFDEGLGTLYSRADGLGMPLRSLVESGQINVQQVDPAELSPGEFVSVVRDAVERDACRVIVIDSLNGYLQAMPQEEFLAAQLHELLAYLRQHGVVVIMVVAQHGFVGVAGPVDISYLADNVILTRFFEAEGRVRKAISVVKKRAGHHEDTIREFSLGADGLQVGAPLSQFRGVLNGTPELTGNHGVAG